MAVLKDNFRFCTSWKVCNKDHQTVFKYSNICRSSNFMKRSDNLQIQTACWGILNFIQVSQIHFFLSYHHLLNKSFERERQHQFIACTYSKSESCLCTPLSVYTTSPTKDASKNKTQIQKMEKTTACHNTLVWTVS